MAQKQKIRSLAISSQLLKSITYTLLLFFLVMSASANGHAHKRFTDQEVKKAIIAESIDSYPGSCPCPYSTTRNGKLCGRRSAWSRPGGSAPICYEKEVSFEMVREWRDRHGINSKFSQARLVARQGNNEED